MKLKIFKNNQFGEVRVIARDNEPWFVAGDIASILNYRSSNDMTRILDEDEKGTHYVSTPGGKQHMTIINESGLYSCILKSTKPQAKLFRKWVTSEVLPSIRKNGGYIANQENLTPEQVVANALVVAQKIIDDKTKQIETMKPKVEFYDQVTQSEDLLDIKQVASILDLGFGRNKLFAKLRDLKVLDQYNMPYQKYIDAKYFKVVETKKGNSENVKVFPKTCVYQKGLNFIRKLVTQ